MMNVYRDEEKNLYGYKTEDGCIVIPSQFEKAEPFINGRAFVKYPGERGYDVIDSRGFKWSVKRQYEDTLEDLPSSMIFSHGLAIVKEVGLGMPKVINVFCETVIDCHFKGSHKENDNVHDVEDIERFGEDAFVVRATDGLSVIMNVQGDIMYYSTKNIYTISDDYFVNGDVVVNKSFNRMMFRLPQDIKYVHSVGDGFFLCSKEEDDKYGYLDMNGKGVIPFIFENADIFNEGIAPVKMEGKWGFIDYNGMWLIEPMFKHVSYIKDGKSTVTFFANDYNCVYTLDIYSGECIRQCRKI